MTNREKAIVMAFTGMCMLTEDKFNIFHKYVEELMGRPVYTHELGFLADEIKEKAKDDFIKLCKEDVGMTYEEKSAIVIEQLRADRDRLLSVIDKIKAEINTPNKGTCDYFIVDRIEEIINKYKAESEVQK